MKRKRIKEMNMHLALIVEMCALEKTKNMQWRTYTSD